MPSPAPPPPVSCGFASGCAPEQDASHIITVHIAAINHNRGAPFFRTADLPSHLLQRLVRNSPQNGASAQLARRGAPQSDQAHRPADAPDRLRNAAAHPPVRSRYSTSPVRSMLSVNQRWVKKYKTSSGASSMMPAAIFTGRTYRSSWSPTGWNAASIFGSVGKFK